MLPRVCSPSRLQLSHTDPNPNRSWTMRIGKGGGIYSFRSSLGEVIPPQAVGNAPFVDEVWQGVAVDFGQHNPRTGQDYYIHQAGLSLFLVCSAARSIALDRPTPSHHLIPIFTAPAGIYFDQTPGNSHAPFFSPSLARYCNATTRECGFASWGQQAHVPTNFTSEVLYYTRFKDCGNGAIEMTWG